jgi:hypothetical protein
MLTVQSIPDEFSQFVTAARRAFECQGPRAFDEMVEPFGRLGSATNSLVAQLMLDELRPLLSEPHKRSVGWDTNQLLLEVNKDFSLGVSVLHVSPPHLLNSVAHAAYLILGQVPFEYRMYRVPDSCSREVFDDSQAPVFVESRVRHPGELLRITAGVDVIDWTIVKPVVLLRFISAPSEPLQWTYRKAPMQPWFIASVDPGATQLSALCDYLAAHGYADAATPMLGLLEHRNHQVRWEATQALWRIDRKAGLQALERCKTDTHPHVRSAAHRTQHRLNQLALEARRDQND